MKGILVYKTSDGYIELFKNRLEYIDYSCQHQVINEDGLRDVFSIETDDIDGEFKILVNPQEFNIKEIQYHKDLVNFTELQEINVRYDCGDKDDLINRIANMMLNSDLVLDGLFDRFNEFFSEEQKKRYLYGKYTDNEYAKLNVIGYFLEDRFKEKDGYLFARELEEYCSNIYKEELDLNNNKTRG